MREHIHVHTHSSDWAGESGLIFFPMSCHRSRTIQVGGLCCTCVVCVSTRCAIAKGPYSPKCPVPKPQKRGQESLPCFSRGGRVVLGLVPFLLSSGIRCKIQHCPTTGSQPADTDATNTHDHCMAACSFMRAQMHVMSRPTQGRAGRMHTSIKAMHQRGRKTVYVWG